MAKEAETEAYKSSLKSLKLAMKQMMFNKKKKEDPKPKAKAEEKEEPQKKVEAKEVETDDDNLDRDYLREYMKGRKEEKDGKSAMVTPTQRRKTKRKKRA